MQRIATIVTKKPGFLVPEAYLQNVLKKTTAAGYAMQAADESGKKILIADTLAGAPTIEEVMELQEHFKDSAGILYFAEFPAGFDEGDVQPFTVQLGDETSCEDVLAFAIEGDFPGYSTNKEHSDERNLLDEIIMPTLSKSLKYADGDLSKFYAELSEPVFEKHLLNTFSHRGVFAFLPVEGDIIAVGRNQLGEVYEWGTVSQTHGYSESKAEDQQPVVEEKKGWWNKAKAKPVAVAEVKPVVPTPIKEVVKPKVEAAVVNKTKIEPVKTETAVLSKVSSPEGAGEGHWETPPANLGHRERKAWVRKMQGKQQLPSGWKDADFKVWVKGPIKDLKSLENNIQKTEQKATPTAVAVVASNPPKSGGDIAAQRNKEDTKVVPITDKNVRKAQEASSMILDKDGKSKVESFILKHLDTQSNVIPNPLEIQKIEAKYPVFSESVGIKPQDIFLWTSEQILELPFIHQKAAGLALLEMRRMAMSSIKMEDLAGTSKTEAPLKSEAPVAVETAPKRAFSVFGRGRKAG